jgi:uncharacterized protein
MKRSMMKELIKYISSYFDKKGAHDMTHTKRVLKVALQIAKSEKNVDEQIIIASCLLHDVARKKEDEDKCECHAEEGARIAPRILRRIKFPENKIQSVVYAIKVHRKSKDIKPKTIEAKILQDADRVDLLGAIGITKTIIRHSKNNDAVIHSPYAKKLNSHKDYKTESIFNVIKIRLKIPLNTFNTLRGKKIALERFHFLKSFIKQFEKEWA